MNKHFLIYRLKYLYTWKEEYEGEQLISQNWKIYNIIIKTQ